DRPSHFRRRPVLASGILEARCRNLDGVAAAVPLPHKTCSWRERGLSLAPSGSGLCLGSNLAHLKQFPPCGWLQAAMEFRLLMIGRSELKQPPANALGRQPAEQACPLAPEGVHIKPGYLGQA